MVVKVKGKNCYPQVEDRTSWEGFNRGLGKGHLPLLPWSLFWVLSLVAKKDDPASCVLHFAWLAIPLGQLRVTPQEGSEARQPRTALAQLSTEDTRKGTASPHLVTLEDRVLRGGSRAKTASGTTFEDTG